MTKHPALLAITLLTQCAPGPIDADPGLAIGGYYDIEAGKTLEGIRIPLLRSPALEKRWGKPRVTVMPDGGYLLAYSSPNSDFESLRIFGTPRRIDSDRPQPPTYRDIDFKDEKVVSVDREQKWQTITLAGRPLHYHLLRPGSGADAPEWSTVTFPVEQPGRPAASYRILASSNLEDGGKFALSYMETVTF